MIELIRSQIAELEETIEQLKESAKPVSPDNAIGRLSRMEAMSEQNIKMANLKQAQARLVGLKGALKRVDTEDFGLCQECEEPIAEKRLKIFPETLLCTVCMEKRSS